MSDRHNSLAPTLMIVTPAMNARDTIDRTIQSIVTQAGNFFIRYHVQDGGSVDGTLARLAWWTKRLTDPGQVPLHCRGITFSYTSAADSGMYEAILRGFATIHPRGDSFMAWINADDIFMPGAFAMIAAIDRQFDRRMIRWVGGHVAILQDDKIIQTADRKIPTAVIRAGLCDGMHWDFIQQEGVFFRADLWYQVGHRAAMDGFRLAGDWNLWRLFAQRASLVQVTAPLGAFRLRALQLSSIARDAYMAEIAATLPVADRRAALAALVAAGDVTRRILQSSYPDGILTLSDQSLTPELAHHARRALKQEMPQSGVNKPARPMIIGKPMRHVTQDHNITAFDHDWQYPAITEQHAFHRMRDSGGCPAGITYVAYPWATLFDKVNFRAIDAGFVQADFQAFCRTLPAGTRRMTVCQHIDMPKFLHFLVQAGIDEVFWSHARIPNNIPAGDPVEPDLPGAPQIHPFPLYPVQVTTGFDSPADHLRPYLFSFVGAQANQWYMTQVRSWILAGMSQDPRGLILGRGEWHYRKVVYDHQIIQSNTAQDKNRMVSAAASDTFRASLRDSVFSLCPSGTGPNSIRLWESIGAGAIPVILSDQYLPPGHRDLWNAAVVFCAETPDAVRALPDRLAAIAADPGQLAAMRHALRQLWLLYGPDGFVTDIRIRMLGHPIHALDRRQAARILGGPGGGPRGGPGLLARLLQTGQIASPPPRTILLQAGAALLDDPDRAADLGSPDTPSGALLAAACAALPAGDPTRRHVEGLLHRPRQATAAPALLRHRAVTVCLWGAHSNRTPLAYPALRPFAADRIILAEDPAAADVIVTGYVQDLRDGATQLSDLLARRPATRIAVISEEPLWDTVWSGDYTSRSRTLSDQEGGLPFAFLNHQTSDIFAFRRVPYFLLTADSFFPRYQSLLAAQRGQQPADLLDRWARAPIRAAFMAERRTNPKYGMTDPLRDVAGLCLVRTALAEAVSGPGVLRAGRGWHSTEPQTRDVLPDWHLDKLATLAGRALLVSAIENTHQRHYITEKIFDAFAAGAVPLYHASPAHRIAQIVPPAAMINLYGLDADTMAARVLDFHPDHDFARAYLEAQAGVLGLVSDSAAVIAERRRVMTAVADEIAMLR